MPAAGSALRMPGKIHDWLADLPASDQAAVAVVGQALAALLNEGVRLGEPSAVSTGSLTAC